MTELISRDRLELALKYLAESDEPCARARANHARAEFKAKSIRNTLIQASTAKTVADRAVEAETSEVYCKAKAEEFEAFFEYEKKKNKRITETIVIDTWRSLNAGRNKGNIV